MKYIIVTILLMLSTFSNAQPNSNTIKFGVYFGGICQDGTTCGEWLIKPYSTFIFAKFEGEIIKNIGSGTQAYIKNRNSIKFTFAENTMPILENAKFEYTSETKIPYDSIFISGQIKNKQGENPPFATIGLDDKHGITSDKYGHYKAAFLRNRRNSIRLSFTSIGYNGQSFILNPTSNFHKLNVKLPLVDTLSCSKVFNSIENTPSLTYKNEIIFYLNTPSVKMKHSMAISFIEKDNKSTLINQLLKAKERQPALSMNIDELITLINK